MTSADPAAGTTSTPLVRICLFLGRQLSWLVAAALAAWSAWHCAGQLGSDVVSYRRWINQGWMSWDLPGPYPVLVNLVWWPLRANHLPAADLQQLWVLGWTVPATVIACLVLWRSTRHPWAAVTVWLLAAATLERAYWLRLEPLAALLALVAVVSLRSGRASSAGLATAAGTMLKVWPAFLAPLMLLISGTRRRLAVFLTAATLPWVVWAAAVTVTRPPAAFDWATFALTRKTQIESLTALWPLWAMAGGDERYTIRYVRGSDFAYIIFGPHLDRIHLALQAVGVVLLLVTAALVLRWLRDLRRRTATLEVDPAGAGARQLFQIALHAQVIVLIVMMFAGPVFSPQYLIWYAPVLAVAVGEGVLRGEAVIWLLACAFTGLVYPVYYDALRAAQTHAVALLTVRDAVLLILLLRCGYRLQRLTRPAGVDSAAPPDRSATRTPADGALPR